MNAKFLLLLCLCLSVLSCTSYRDFISIENRYIPGELDHLEQGKYLKVFLNETPVTLLFDTGSQRSVLLDLEAIGGEEILTPENFNSMNTMFLANGNRLNAGLLKLDSMRLESVQSANRKIMLINQQNSYLCQDSTNVRSQGIYGIENLFESEVPLLINYTTNTIGFVEQPDLSEFKKVDAFFKRKYIGVRLLLHGEKINLHFDTGNTNGIILKTDQLHFKPTPIDNTAEVLNALADESLDVLTLKRHTVEEFRSGELILSKVPIQLTDDIAAHNMGLDFIKQFDWIIDFKNKQLYARAHSNAFQNTLYNLVKQPMLVAPINNRLVIGYAELGDHSFRAGDVIKMINGEVITSENICLWYRRLNTNSDWSQYEIIVQTSDN